MAESKLHIHMYVCYGLTQFSFANKNHISFSKNPRSLVKYYFLAKCD